jgi:hypothetical protein
MTEMAFIALLSVGLVGLLSALFWTRLHWRKDIPPYGLQTRKLEVFLHPERFTRGGAVHIIRVVSISGLILLLAAFGLAAYGIVRTMVAK